MRITAVMNLKGGVAKTTTAINMAAILARRHRKRVLLVDADSQCNLTEFMGADPGKGNLAKLLREPKAYYDNKANYQGCVQNTRYKNIDILPGDESLMDLDLSKVEQNTLDAYVLRVFLGKVKTEYDYVIIDCPPAFNAACVAALIAANDVIIPIKLDAFSLRGMANLMRQIRNMRKINPVLGLDGCLPTMWYNDPQILDAEHQLRAAGLPVYPHIRRSDKVDKMTFQQDPLVIGSPHSGAGIDYSKFVRKYLHGIGGK